MQTAQAPAITPAELLAIVHDGLKPLAEHWKGEISLATNPFEVIEMLAHAPGTPRIVILWEGEADATGGPGQSPQGGIVIHTVSLIISANRGLPFWQGGPLASIATDTPSILERLAELRTAALGIAFPGGSTRGRFFYLGAESETTPEGLPLDAYRLRFSLTAKINLPQ